jgi:hypothetical protein
MMRVNNEHHIPTQQNTDFRSFPQLSGLLPSQTLIKRHLNTCLNSKHNRLGWLEYLKMSRTWNFNYRAVIQRRNLVQLALFGHFSESLGNPQGFVIFPMGHIQKGFRRFLGIFRFSIERTRQDFCAVNLYSACDWLIN